MNYVIIGNGIAGLTAAEEIRKNDPEGSIKIISEEKYPTYYRLKLSHYISKDFEPSELYVRNEAWYKDKNIELLLDTRVTTVDFENKKVVLENGLKVDYDKLLFANGSSSFIPPVPGADKKGVYALRNLKNLMEIQDYLKDCKEVTVIGGGLLGLEAAWALKERGLVVNVAEFFQYLLPRQLDQELSAYLKEKLEENGLVIHLNAASKEILGDAEATDLLLNDGRKIKSDLVLFSTGVRPNVNIVKDTDITVSKGIVVDDHMKTSTEDVFAAGDIAEYNGIIMALWTAAQDQGKIAGRNMAGMNESYTMPQPATLLSLGDISIFSVGEINSEKQTLTHREGNVFHKLFIDEGKLVGGVLTGDTKKMAVLKKAVNNKKDISHLLNDNVGALDIINQL